MKKIFAILLCACGLSVHAASYITVTNTFTNRTVVGDSFTVGATTVRFTNAPLNAQSWIVTNSTKASATNLWRFLGRTQPALYTRMADETNVVISGTDLAFGISGGFGFLSTNTSGTTNQYFAALPFHNLTLANRTNQADDLLYGLSLYGFTNTLAANSQALTNFVGKTNEVTLTRKTLTGPFINDGTNSGTVLTNIPRANVNLGVVTNLYALTAVVSNGTLIGTLDINGVFTKLTNGTMYHASVTNAPWVNATNANLTTARIDTLTVWTAATITNLSAPGSGADSFKIGSGSIASGIDSTAIGQTAIASNDYALAIGFEARAGAVGAQAVGYQAVASAYAAGAFGTTAEASAISATALGVASAATHSNSTAIGYSATTTTTNQIRLGTAAETVSVPGVLSVESGITNHVTTGTNRVDARVDYTRRTVNTLVNGANSAIVLGSNVFVHLSGGTTIMALSGFAAAQDGTFHILNISGGTTNVIVNEANSTDFATDAAAANRIITGTGTNFYSTNNPLVLPVIYDATAARWKIISFMR